MNTNVFVEAILTVGLDGYISVIFLFLLCGAVREADECVGALVKVWVYGFVCVFGVVGARGTEREDWGVIQSLHKWIWLIEGASDPDWCTAGAPLIGEGEEWRREWREKRKREYGPGENAPLR